MNFPKCVAREAFERLTDNDMIEGGSHEVCKLLEDALELGLDHEPRDWTGFSYRKAMDAYERELITAAMRDAGGSVSRAAKLLGFAHHQSVRSIMNRLPELKALRRRPASRRYKHLIEHTKDSQTKA